ncbi:MAG: hypothetical protein ACTTKL_02565 [Treponema sp.]
MKRLFLCVSAAVLAARLFAYNPPAGGQTMPALSSPVQLTSASSAAGGAIFYPGPYSIAFNPALTALEQRITLDAGFSVLAANNFNSAMQIGILIPTKRFVASGLLQGVFLNSKKIDLDNSVNFKAGLSKEVAANISVGFNVSAGAIWGSDSDWLLNGDVGLLYRKEVLSFMKDFRVGFSILNLGKTFGGKELRGIRDRNEDEIRHTTDAFPSLATVRAGVGTLFFSNDFFKVGMSLDLTTQAFQNGVLDMGFQFGVKDMVFFSVAESIDIRESLEGYENFMPAIGVGVKFNFRAKNNEYLKKHSWEESEMLAAAAWQQRYGAIQAVSAGAVIKLGLKDKDPPAITIWNGDE